MKPDQLYWEFATYLIYIKIGQNSGGSFGKQQFNTITKGEVYLSVYSSGVF